MHDSRVFANDIISMTLNALDMKLDNNILTFRCFIRLLVLNTKHCLFMNTIVDYEKLLTTNKTNYLFVQNYK